MQTKRKYISFKVTGFITTKKKIEKSQNAETIELKRISAKEQGEIKC